MIKTLASTLALICCLSTAASARDVIRIVGSSTVYPFTTTVAEQFAKKTGKPAPIVESTGTGGGFKLFCEGNGEGTPDLTDASRRIKPEELVNCFKNEVKDISEIKIGYDGIVVANSVKAPKFNLTFKDLFLALARKVPAKDDPKKLVDNYYKTWYQVNSSLPKQKIIMYGLPPTSGTRDTFAELAMEGGCWKLPAYATAYPDLEQRKQACHLLREDGAYIETGENGNLSVQKVTANKDSLGIFGYSFLKENPTLVQASAIAGIMPTPSTVSNGTYLLARPLFIYVKRAHIGVVKGIQEFINEYVSNDTIGEFGYLEEKGLILMPAAELKAIQQDAANGKPLQNLIDEAPKASN